MSRASQLKLDYWYNLAAATELSRRPWVPRDPYVPSDGVSHRFTPHLLVVGLAARVLGAEVEKVLDASAGLNVAVLCIGAFLFCRSFFGHWFPPQLCLLVMLLVWNSPASYSGSYNIIDLLLVATYPSTFAFAFSLVQFWLALKYLRSARWRFLLGCAALQCLIFLSHPIVGSWCLMSIFILGIVETELPVPRKILLIVGAVVGSLASIAWPLYSVVRIGRAGAASWPGLALYRRFWVLSPTAAAGVLGLIGGSKQKGKRFLLIGLLASSALFFTAPLIRFALGRRFIFFLFWYLHLGLALLLWRLAGDSQFRAYLRRPKGLINNASAAAAAGLIVIVGAVAVSQAGGFLYHLAWCNNTVRAIMRRPRLDPDVGESLRFLERYVGEDDVVLSDLATSWAIPCIRGRTVSYQRHDVIFPASGAERSKAVKEFFASSTSNVARRAILERYNVKFVLFDARVTPEKLACEVLRLGRLVHEDGDWVLMRFG